MELGAASAAAMDTLNEALATTLIYARENPALLVVVRQSLALTFLFLGIFAALLTNHSAIVHLWLEGSWWLVATTTAVFLFIQGIFQLITEAGDTLHHIRNLEILEEVELAIYLLLAFFDSMGRTHAGRRFSFMKTVYWVATIFLIILWSVSSLINIVTTGRATPGTIIIMTACVATAVIMLADLCVTALHKIDSDITQQDAEEQARAPRGVHEPLLPKETGGPNGIFVRRQPTGKRPSQHANPDYIV